MDINQVTLVGRLADNVHYVKGVNGSISRAMGRLMVNRRPSKDGGKAADAIQIVAWGKHADNLAEYTTKGKEMAIKGEIRTNNIAPKVKGGEWKNYTEVMVTEISFGRDSTHAKVMKAMHDSAGALGEAATKGTLDQAAINALIASNPELAAELASIAQGKAVAAQPVEEEAVDDTAFPFEV